MSQETAPATETPVIAAGYTFASITDKISMIVLTNPVTRRWWVGFGATFLVVMVLFYSIAYLLYEGVGILSLIHN